VLRSITLKEKFRCFDEGFTLEFRPGINLLVGDQGTGKSSILQLVMMRVPGWKEIAEIDADAGEVKGFDFEKDNPRMVRQFVDNIDVIAQVSMVMVSHGTFNRGMINDMSRMRDIVIALDEPDQALSVRSCYQIIRSFEQAVERGCQIVAAVHNPVVISALDLVYSLEHRDWVTPDIFLESQKTEAANAK